MNAVFTVTLSAASGKTVTVNYATANGTATTSGEDYSSVADRGFRVDPKAWHFYFGMDEDRPAMPSVDWPTGSYRLSAMAIAKQPKEPSEDAVRRLDVVALSWASNSASDPRDGLRQDARQQMPPLVVINVVDQPQFEAVAGEPNLSKISLSEKLLAEVRKRLAMK